MININKDSKVYIACPVKVNSGGPETLHQLVNKLRNIGIDAYIYYFNARSNKKNLIPEKFKNYNIDYVIEIEDIKNNIIIIPEMYTQMLYRFKSIQKIIWWLSVDFYFKSLYKNSSINFLKERNLPKILYPILVLYYIIKNKSYKQLRFEKDTKKNEYFYLYNCEYAKDFLVSNGIKNENMEYLCGPIRKEFIYYDMSVLEKRDIVVYNPAKGYEFTKKIISRMKQFDKRIKFVPIKNLKPVEIMGLLRKSKVYIDFGFFPGPERIPREAVSSYCNIITSDLGSAKNEIDVPIPSKYKINPIDENIDKICELIIDQINNYDKYISDYDKYREKVKTQLDMFDNNIELKFK